MWLALYRSRIERLDGVSIQVKEEQRVVVLNDVQEASVFVQLSQLLRAARCSLSVYDCVYNREADDPGAYFEYSAFKAGKDGWSMTYGNHGWSGGIYEIDHATVAFQLHSLHRRGELNGIMIGRNGLFRHYPKKHKESSEKVASAIRRAHWTT